MSHAFFRYTLALTIILAGLSGPPFCLAQPPRPALPHQPAAASPSPTQTAAPLSLEWALAAAINRHPAMAASRDEIIARQGAAKQAGLLPNPALFGEIEEFGGSGNFSGSGSMSSRIGISQEFPMNGRIGKRLREAEEATRIAELEHQLKIVELEALVEKRFITVFTLQERLKIQTEQLDLIRQTHDVVAKRVKAGDTSPLDLARSQVELASAEITIGQTRGELASARQDLAESWGERTPAFSGVAGRYQPNTDFKEAELRQALEESPAWRLLLAQSTRAEAALALARSGRIPDLELEGGVQRFNESDDQAFFLGFSIPLPLFDRNQGGIAEAQAITRKTQHEGEAGFLALQTELQEAWRRLASTRQALEALEREVLPIALNAYESIGKAYKAGEIDILGLLDAQRTWVETRQSRLDLLHELELSRISITRLIGAGAGPATPPSQSQNHTARNQS
jgi:cobalt-zinc-cadmium efflux system outer membrane protein